MYCFLGEFNTVEIHIKEARFFPSSLDRFLLSRLIFSVSACKILKMALIYTKYFACVYIIFSIGILDDS